MTWVAHFKTVEDPLSQLQHGDTLTFRPVTPTFDGVPRAGQVEDSEKTEGLVLCLMFSDDGSHSIQGSAVMVAAGIALASTHVLESRIAEIESGSHSLMCLGIGTSGVQAWHVKHIARHSGFDICVLSLQCISELPRNVEFHRAMITTRVPAIGERLVMTGFRPEKEAFEIKDRSSELAASLYLSSGNVQNHYLNGRDKTLAPWPSLEVDSPSVGGMSGGPVFDSRGYLVGLISRSFEMGADSEPSPTLVALIWPALAVKFLGGWPFPASEPRSLLELSDNACSIERPSAVKVTSADVSSFDPWT
jgi:hypothetical protein